MEGAAAAHENAYRRGLVLGFTMAEIMLLLLFVLMLIVTFIMVKKNEDASIKKNEIEALLVERKELNRKYSSLMEIMKKIEDKSIKYDFSEMFNELVQVKEENKQLVDSVSTLEDEVIKNEELREAIDKIMEGQPGLETLEGKLGELMEKAKEKNECSILQAENSDLRDSLESTENKRDNLKGQLEHCTKVAKSKGYGHPPCWADSSGKIEYIFNVYLYSAGISIQNNKLPHRAREQQALPLHMITYNSQLSSTSFLKQTSSLFDWSVKNECRFYVNIFDVTGSSDKQKYKEYRKATEAHFYIRIIK